MIAVDSSVAIAAFSTWHKQHDAARKMVAKDVYLPAHSALEVFSVLTRLPAPHRISPGIAKEFLVGQFTTPFLTLKATGYRSLIETLSTYNIVGGAIYDALIACTAEDSGATLVSCDKRAMRTYEQCGAHIHYLF